MKALSVRPPWAWAIAHARKRVENRSRRTTYRGPVAIHASKNLKGSDLKALERILGRPVDPQRFVRGAIVATALLVDVVPAERCHNRWVVGPWCWVLRKIRPLKDPIYLSGSLGLWDPSSRCTRSQMAKLRAHAKR